MQTCRADGRSSLALSLLELLALSRLWLPGSCTRDQAPHAQGGPGPCWGPEGGRVPLANTVGFPAVPARRGVTT